MKILSYIVLISTVFSVGVSNASKQKLSKAQIGSKQAKSGGSFYFPLSSEPESLNPINSSDYVASQTQDFIMEGLLEINPETYEWMPRLAERYEVGKGAKSYTFYLRKDARFHDGSPVTADDVKFSIDALRDPAYKASHRLPYFENIGNVDVIDKHTVKFNIKKPYFNNFAVIASGGFLSIVPKNTYKDPKKKMSKKIVGSGPYMLRKYNKGKNIILEKNRSWWGWKVPHLKGRYNQDRITLRFVREENLEIQMMEKGKLHYLPMGKEAFYQKTKKAPWGKSVLKMEVKNSKPKGYGFIGWNFKDPKFQDKNVRLALTQLLNRELINEKFRYGKSELATGPWHKYSMYANQTVRPIRFDPDSAKKLLDKAGWKDTNKDGIRDKKIGGKRVDFAFTLLLPNRDVEKYFTLYKEDLKKAGINMTIKYVEWNTFLKSIDSKKFEAITLAWSGGSVHLDPKQIWHSDSARKGGSNFISYSNKTVDKLIDEARVILDHNARAKKLRLVYKLIAEDVPYSFLFNDPITLYGLSGKMEQNKPTLKFNEGYTYWWLKSPK